MVGKKDGRAQDGPEPFPSGEKVSKPGKGRDTPSSGPPVFV